MLEVLNKKFSNLNFTIDDETIIVNNSIVLDMNDSFISIVSELKRLNGLYAFQDRYVICPTVQDLHKNLTGIIHSISFIDEFGVARIFTPNSFTIDTVLINKKYFASFSTFMDFTLIYDCRSEFNEAIENTKN